MRIAVLSDVHGNLTALQAVLSDIKRQGVDQTIFAGDLCFVGPRPAECIKLMQEAEIFCTHGNTDEWILGRQIPPDHLRELVEWTREKLDLAEIEWLNGLPFSIQISPLPGGQKNLLITHANPVDVNQLIFPSESQQLAMYQQIRQTDENLNELLRGLECAVLAYGHLHIPGKRIWREIELFNISSVSMPGDGDPRAKYGLFTWHDGDWGFRRREVAFDMHEEIEAYRQVKLPGWQNIIEKIEQEGSFPQRV